MRALLIEDEQNILEAIRFLLTRDGWEVMAHGNGATAIEAVARAEPDVIVLDVMLPGRSGMEILTELRGMPATKDLPVLMLTAKGQAQDRDKAYALGANAFMTKPFANSEILETMRELCPTADCASDTARVAKTASGP